MKTRFLALIFLFAFFATSLVTSTSAPILKSSAQQTQNTESGTEKWDGMDDYLHNVDLVLVAPDSKFYSFQIHEAPASPYTDKLRRPPKIQA